MEKTRVSNMLFEARAKERLATTPWQENLSEQEKDKLYQCFWQAECEREYDRLENPRYGSPTQCGMCGKPWYQCRGHY